jgi:hypothetical protein
VRADRLACDVGWRAGEPFFNYKDLTCPEACCKRQQDQEDFNSLDNNVPVASVRKT